MRAFFFAASAMLVGVACSSAAVSNEGTTDADAGDDASTGSTTEDARAPIDSGAVVRDSGPSSLDSGSDASETTPFAAPDGGCSFESIAAERSAGTCTKNILESCGGDQLLLECDCNTNTCTCTDDSTGTAYATFTPNASVCADPLLADGGGCSSFTGIADDAKTHCGIY